MKKNIMNKLFGNKLAKLRGNIKQYEISRFIGVSPSQWGRYEKGVVPPYDILSKIASHFGIDDITVLFKTGEDEISLPDDKLAESTSEYSTTCPADPVCQEICKVCMTLPPDDKESTLELMDILRSGDNETILAIKQNLKQFRKLVSKESNDFKIQKKRGMLSGRGRKD